MTNWGILSWLVKQTRLSWTDTQSSPYGGVQPCAAVTLQYTLGSLANIKPPRLPVLVRHPSSLTQLHVWNGNITAHRLSGKKRSLFFLKPGNFFQVLSCEIWNPCMDSFFLLFLYEAFPQPVLHSITPYLFSTRVFWFSALLLLIPLNLCLDAVVRLGGNGFSGYQVERK